MGLRGEGRGARETGEGDRVGEGRGGRGGTRRGGDAGVVERVRVGARARTRGLRMFFCLTSASASFAMVGAPVRAEGLPARRILLASRRSEAFVALDVPIGTSRGSDAVVGRKSESC